MATRTVYITVQLNIDNPNVKEITDEDINHIINETDYEFKDVDDFQIDTEICGRNDEGDF